jgi:isopentenyl phosphate kinase
VLQLENLVIVKLGGSVITHKESSPPTVNEKHLARIAKELAIHDGKLVVVLGGGAHGHQAAHKHGFGNPDSTPKQRLAGIPEIRHNMTSLASRVEIELNSQGIPSVVFSPFMFVTLRDNLIDYFPTKIIKETLKAGSTVIIHGDVCIDETESVSILSGDTIAKYLAEHLKPKAVFIGTNVDGVMDDNPVMNPNAKHIPFINNSNKDEIFSLTGPSTSTDVTGGMTKKITELLAIANQNIDIVIFNLLVEGRLKALFENDTTICTRIQPA